MRKKFQPSLFEKCFSAPRESPVILVPDSINITKIVFRHYQ